LRWSELQELEEDTINSTFNKKWDKVDAILAESFLKYLSPKRPNKLKLHNNCTKQQISLVPAV
jgi:lambda repressor-like predicted transcriptional regulator